jgi:hypothetical protein
MSPQYVDARSAKKAEDWRVRNAWTSDPLAKSCGARLVARSNRFSLVQGFNDFIGRLSTFAGRMSEAAGTDSILNIKNQIVARTRRDSHRYRVEL